MNALVVEVAIRTVSIEIGLTPPALISGVWGTT